MENENITNDDLKQYEALKPDLKKVIGDRSIDLLAIIILFTFVPFFKINITDGQVILAQKSFSVFDEIKNILSYIELSWINGLNGKSMGIEWFFGPILILPMVAVVQFVEGAMLSTRSIMATEDSDKYAWKTYCKIKWGDPKFSFFSFGVSAIGDLLGVLFLEIFIILCGVLMSKYGDYISYLNSCNGIEWLQAIALVIYFVLFVVLAIIRSTMLKKIKVSILKEKYKA